jgi:capsular polysaccharide export protein
MRRGQFGPEFDGPVYAHGFSWRKRRYVREFSGRTDVRFVSDLTKIGPGSVLFLWGSAERPAHLADSVQVVRIEDGFLRSVGLGADLTRPLSWVFDDLGIYYDARQSSALERILETENFSATELELARSLRELIVGAGLTKYNLAARHWCRPPTTARVILVPGQVESDASIAGGCHTLRTNLELLQAVRRACPDAWIVYKPHPDVVAGLRGRGVGEDRAGQVCDEILTEGSMHDLLQQVDEIHVLTSLAGFEALLRHKPVVCWGHPFYAGWGLTRDDRPHPRRTKRRSLAELVAGSLVRYPVYVSGTGRRCSPEETVQELLRWRARARADDPWWRHLLRLLIARP